MSRINTEYVAKLQNAYLRRQKLHTDIAIFKEEMQIRKSLEKVLDEMT